jgi:predicted nucleotidyltransferase
MEQLTTRQHHILDRVVDALDGIDGIRAIVLGGSHARGRARADSDLDIGLYYDAVAPFDIAAIVAIAAQLNDTPRPVVSDFYAWGRWVNGGAWLTIEGQRVDLLYRAHDDVVRTYMHAQEGRFEIDTDQQPPFGFFGPTLLGEVAIARPLRDAQGMVGALKQIVTPMPEALVCAVVQDRLWQVEFGLKAFAPKFVSNTDAYGLAGCMTRFAFALVLTLFALNRVYLLNDKTALQEIDAFPAAPTHFSDRIKTLLAHIGADATRQQGALKEITSLFEETRALANGLYQAAWKI